MWQIRAAKERFPAPRLTNCQSHGTTSLQIDLEPKQGVFQQDIFLNMFSTLIFRVAATMGSVRADGHSSPFLARWKRSLASPALGESPPTRSSQSGGTGERAVVQRGRLRGFTHGRFSLVCRTGHWSCFAGLTPSPLVIAYWIRLEQLVLSA